MNHQMHTNQTAAEYITRAIESAGTDVATVVEYDVNGIARELRAEAGSWDVSTIDHDLFWAVVERHEYSAIAEREQGAYVASLNTALVDKLHGARLSVEWAQRHLAELVQMEDSDYDVATGTHLRTVLDLVAAQLHAAEALNVSTRPPVTR